ncbi:MAG: hypothetical protein WC521_04460 [Bdellovibrionales bacterium]|jgi:hypothetical protein
MMDWILPLLGGLGIGTLLKGIVDHFLAVKSKSDERIYLEKRETYLGLIDAMYESDVHPSLETQKNYGKWHNRCKLYGSHAVVDASQRFIDTSSAVTGEARSKAYRELFEEMRKDLGA